MNQTIHKSEGELQRPWRHFTVCCTHLGLLATGVFWCVVNYMYTSLIKGSQSFLEDVAYISSLTERIEYLF